MILQVHSFSIFKAIPFHPMFISKGFIITQSASTFLQTLYMRERVETSDSCLKTFYTRVVQDEKLDKTKVAFSACNVF